MYILILSLFIACVFPILAKIPLGFAMAKQPEGYDNHHPRTQQARLTEFGARALAAHKNSFESLVIFAAAVLTPIATRHITHTIEGLALVYLVSRVGYYLCYWYNWSSMRSTIWAIGYLSSLSMIWLCLP